MWLTTIRIIAPCSNILRMLELPEVSTLSRTISLRNNVGINMSRNNGLFGEFGLLDILTVLNYVENRRTNKYVKRLQKLQIYAAFSGDDELNEILKELRQLNKSHQ